MVLRAGWRVDAQPRGSAGYRNFTLFIQEEDELSC